MKIRSLALILALLVLPAMAYAAGNCTKDGGKDYFEKGIASVEGIGDSEDTCISEQRLIEYYCDEEGTLGYDYYDCEGVCEEGRCVGSAAETNETTTVTNETCIENWECTEWTNCTNSQQTRTCEDLNSCNTIVEKPEETRACSESSTQPTAQPSTQPAAPSTPQQQTQSSASKYKYWIIGGVIALLVVLYFIFKEKEPEIRGNEKKEEVETKQDENKEE